MSSHFPLGQISDSDRETIIRRLHPLFGHRNVRLRLFGSRARGDAGSRSDIDLALVAAGKLPPDLLARAREAIEEAPIPFRADIVDYHAADDRLRRAIDHDGIEWTA